MSSFLPSPQGKVLFFSSLCWQAIEQLELSVCLYCVLATERKHLVSLCPYFKRLDENDLTFGQRRPPGTAHSLHAFFLLFALFPARCQCGATPVYLVNIIIDDGQHMTVQRLSTAREKCEISLEGEVSSNRVCPINLTLSRKVNQWSMPS